MTSHVLFVFFVFMLINLDKSRQYRGPPKTGLEWVIVIWIIGFICHSILTLMSIGARRYFSFIWNWYDLLTHVVFLMTFLFWGKAYLDVQHYPNTEERKAWPSFDATLIHEGLLAIASVMAFGRILYFLQQSATIGPYQISLERMSFDIVSFLSVAFIIILSFATGMTRLYQYYNGMVQIDENKHKKAQLSSFVRFDYSVKTLFWALFGMSPVEAADVIISNLETGGKTIRHHLFTEGVGHFLYSLYHLIIGIALINVLIAILTTSYQDVVDNADTEWKYSRTRLWLRYINYPSTIPPPLSLIPLVDFIGNKISEHRKLPREQTQNIQCSLKSVETKEESKGWWQPQPLIQSNQEYPKTSGQRKGPDYDLIEGKKDGELGIEEAEQIRVEK
ncbi:short transient receptor potential channel 5-like [Limulus polyphemus]|uniref:Short transient receptor potential channel 5-like n=1 Tax=Limulus polyphemus TaxID=6850 RepID=A0ABM1BXC9_LIMPO|nr:short transient receptor potential channel 5-like [Limulus polyphemus]